VVVNGGGVVVHGGAVVVSGGTVAVSGGTQSAVSIAAQVHEGESQAPGGGRAKFPTPLPDALRKPRTIDDMEKEAKMLAKFMAEYDTNSRL